MSRETKKNVLCDLLHVGEVEHVCRRGRLRPPHVFEEHPDVARRLPGVLAVLDGRPCSDEGRRERLQELI